MKSEKKLSILTHSLASGGAERVISILLNELCKQYDVTLVLMNSTIHYELPNNQKIIFLTRSKLNENPLIKLFKLPLLAWKYKQWCHENNIAISLSFTNRPNFVAILSKILGNQSTILINERSYPSEQHKYGIQGLTNRTLISWLYPKADVITANSSGNTHDLKETFGINRIKTIYNPFDIDLITLLMQPMNPISKNSFIFLSVGRLDHGKNHTLLINAMQHLDATLWIIGEGPLKSTLQKQINNSNLQEKVILLGRQDNPFSYMAQADCFVFASNHEGFPNVLVEALACGLPVISTDCPSGPKEILDPSSNPISYLKDGIKYAEYGLLVPVNNTQTMTKAMTLIMNDETIRNTYKNKSKLRALDFDKSKIIEQFIAAIEA